MNFLRLLFVGFSTIGISSAKDAPKTQVFVEAIEPSLFNWTNAYTKNAYWYRAALMNSPDLPQWMSYHYSNKHGKGFIYGAPPDDATDVQVEVVGMNRGDYETRKATIFINITEKTDPAKYEIRLKIDNLNLDDMFEPNRVFKLLNIFTTVLWQGSDDLYMTNLVSAVKMGARLPLSPDEGEGVVVHLGSSKPFSTELEELEQEVSPLRKLTPCPRALKRSTVDRHFRPRDFLIDWCSFRLVTLKEDKPNQPTPFQEKPLEEENNSKLFKMDDKLIRIEDIPKRDYTKELMSTMIVPAISLLTLAAFLSVILCVQHDSVEDPDSERFFESIFLVCENCRDRNTRTKNEREKPCQEENLRQSIEPVQRQQVTLRDGNHDIDRSPQLSKERDDACRPSPPPYSATKRFDFDS